MTKDEKQKGEVENVVCAAFGRLLLSAAELYADYCRAISEDGDNAAWVGGVMRAFHAACPDDDGGHARRERVAWGLLKLSDTLSDALDVPAVADALGE